MDNFSIFVRAAARFMAADRPDIYNEDTAHRDLVTWYSELSSKDKPGSMGTGGFSLVKSVDDEGDVYWMLSRHIVELSVFITETDSDVFDWTAESKLVGQVDLGVPVHEEEDDDEGLDEDHEDLV